MDDPVVAEFPELVDDSDFELWEELRPQIVAALEAKINERKNQ